MLSANIEQGLLHFLVRSLESILIFTYMLPSSIEKTHTGKESPQKETKCITDTQIK